MIRVGRIRYQKESRSVPSYENFTPIMVMTQCSEYGSLSPYLLTDEKGRNMENCWQFSKVYKTVPSHTAKKSRWNPTIIWKHPAEVHYDEKTDTLTPRFWRWRKLGMAAKHPIRYPVGFNHRHKCMFAIPLDSEPPKLGLEIFRPSASPPPPPTKLNYIESRKAIYLPLFCKLVKSQPQFSELKERLKRGENLLILEVDGPHQESLTYYKTKYGVQNDFIQDYTIQITKPNMQIMMNDPKHPFGHGYCLAMALLGVDDDPEWTSSPSFNVEFPSFF